MHLAFGRRAMLSDDMGLGKTVQAIDAAASLKHQWAREIRRFTSLSVTVFEGNLEERRSLYADPSFFKIINYELVRFDMTNSSNCIQTWSSSAKHSASRTGAQKLR